MQACDLPPWLRPPARRVRVAQDENELLLTQRIEDEAVAEAQSNRAVPALHAQDRARRGRPLDQTGVETVDLHVDLEVAASAAAAAAAVDTAAAAAAAARATAACAAVARRVAADGHIELPP